MPTADATLLPPPFSLSSSEDPLEEREERGSVRRLDHVGVEAVLGAMIEQKRRSSQPSFAAIELPPDSARAERDEGEEGDASDEREAEDAPPGGRAPTRSAVYLKAR